jgi:murein DD-endopeptidase MepM/ murein hydrolase activator NlpD
VLQRLLPGILFVVAILAVAGSAGAASSNPDSSSRAFGVHVVAPNGQAGTAGGVSAPPQAAASLASYSYGDGAIVTGAVSAGTRATKEDGSASGAATVRVSSVSLFGGEITAEAVDLRSVARASPGGAGGRMTSSSLTNVTLLGEPVEPAVNSRIKLDDWGYAVLLEQAVVRQGGRRLGYRGFITGIHVHLTAAHGGLPAGTEILIGYAEAAASAPRRTPVQSSSEGEQAAPKGDPPRDPVPPPPGAPEPAPPPLVKEPPAGVEPELTAEGYVFPVYGPASFSDDFRAGRAQVGWHHGNDVFAPLGAPILAVTDGTLLLVGWNSLGGNRLWLRDDEGNEFYYAHLSAFSPLAADGVRVRAGDVLGFVGTTGDAVGTPPHLHFEIHPAELLWLGYDGVINPYSYLLAWRRLLDASFDASWRPAPGKAPPAGAVLLLAEDIATKSALESGGLTGMLSLPPLFGEAPPGPKIVNAALAFGAR